VRFAQLVEDQIVEDRPIAIRGAELLLEIFLRHGQ